MTATDPRSKSLWISLRRLRQLFNRRQKIGFGILLIGMIGAALMEAFSIAVIPIYFGVAIDPSEVLQHERFGPILSSLGIATSRNMILWGALALLLVFLAKTLYIFLLTYFQICYTQNRQLQLTDRLFTAYMSAPYEFHLNRNTSELLRNTNLEVEAIIYRVLTPILTLTLQGLMVLALVGLLIITEPLVSLAAVMLFGVAGGGYELLLRSRLRTRGARAQIDRDRILQIIQQGLGALKEVRVLRREDHFTRDLRQRFEELLSAYRLGRLAERMTVPYMEFLAIAGLLGVGIVLISLGRDPQAIAAILILFAAVFIRLKAGVAAIVSGFTMLRFNAVSIDPVYKDLKRLRQPDTELSIEKRALRTKPVRLERVLNLVGIWYRYPEATEYALQDISVSIYRGEAVAFVGPTGSGKTTIIDAILGLVGPQRGEIMVDGKNIHDNLTSWQRTIGYVPQFIYLIDDTIRRNVALGLEDEAIDETQVWRAIGAAQLDGFVNTLSDGLDTVVGEHGIRLSGGQRQRIGIARALYRDPDILVMDEATSALDNTTEREVMNAVRALKGRRTLIMIAHRMTTVEACDRLYTMRDGRIEAIGAEHELVQENQELCVALA